MHTRIVPTFVHDEADVANLKPQMLLAIQIAMQVTQDLEMVSLVVRSVRGHKRIPGTSQREPMSIDLIPRPVARKTRVLADLLEERLGLSYVVINQGDRVVVEFRP